MPKIVNFLKGNILSTMYDGKIFDQLLIIKQNPISDIDFNKFQEFGWAKQEYYFNIIIAILEQFYIVKFGQIFIQTKNYQF